MKASAFRQSASGLHSLARRQRAVRLLLRTLWTYGGGYLLGWGVNDLWEWPKDEVWFHAFGLALVVFGLSPYLRMTSKSRFFWNVDRQLGYKEQFSTAWKVANQEESGPIHTALLEETMGLAPALRKRLTAKGRDWGGELQAGLIVLILLGMVWLAGFSIVPQVPEGFSLPIPGLGFDPTGLDIFPSGIPGDTAGEGGEAGTGDGSGEGEDGQEGDSEYSSEDLGEVGDILEELGEELSENAATAALGEALEQGDLEAAADELEALAGQLDQLSDETLEDLAEEFQEAAGELEQANQEGLADQMDQTGDALQDGDTAGAGEEMDNLAEELRVIGAQAASDPVEGEGIESGDELGSLQEGEGTGGGGEGGDVGIGANEPQQGDPEDFERLDGSGEVFDLSEFGDESGFLQAGLPPEEISDEVVGGAFDYVGPEDTTIITGVFDPFNLPWTRRDVITEYFSH